MNKYIVIRFNESAETLLILIVIINSSILILFKFCCEHPKSVTIFVFIVSVIEHIEVCVFLSLICADVCSQLSWVNVHRLRWSL